MRVIILQIALLCLFATHPAMAENVFGLAMTGEPKYGTTDEHLDYARPDAPKGGTLRQAALGSFDTLNPFNIKGTAAQGLSFINDRLMGRVWDEPFTLYPLIARTIEIPEDRSSMTIQINQDAKFSDGTKITADDVVFTFETLRDHGRPNMRRVYKLVKEITKYGDDRVAFILGDGYDRETVMIIAMMPVLSKKWWEGRDFNATTLQIYPSSGPYKIASVEPGRKIVYERIPDYWGADLLVNKGHYNFDRLVFDYYRDDTVALEAFKAGAVDMRREYDPARWMSAYDFPAMKKGEMKREELSHGRPERVRSFIFNTRRPPFDDARVREALQYALDAEWVNKTLFHGKFKRISSYYPNSELAASGTPDELELSYLEPWRGKVPDAVFGPAWAAPTARTAAQMRENIRHADTLLKSAGWVVKDGKRVREDDPAKEFTFEILLNAPEDEKVALAFVRGLQKLGITPTLRVLDSAAFTGRLNDYDYDMVLYYWINTLSPGTEQLLYWGCDAAGQKGRFNYAGICNPAIDALSKSIAGSSSREELAANVRALDRVLTWGNYMIPLYYAGTDNVASRSPLHHPAATPLYGMVLETWWME